MIGFQNHIKNPEQSLNCQMDRLEQSSSEYKMIDKYMNNTKGHYKIDILDAFKLCRSGEDQSFNPNKLGNKVLLWHGSRRQNFVGILSQGLLVNPPNVFTSGRTFGNGIYFADVACKAAPYTRASQSGGIGVFLLCEVALGKSKELYQINTLASKLPKGYHSTKGIGVRIPNPKGNKTIDNDVTVQLGKLRKNPDKQASRQYAEYVVYKEEQVKLRYLVKVKMAF